jgi:hypothetical protein
MPSGTSSGKPRWRKWILIALTPFAIVPIGYAVTRYQSVRRLELAIAEADRLDPGWRFEELEAARRPFPAPEKNGIKQVLRVAAATPKPIWPEWPFPQFNNDQDYLTEVRRAMDEGLAGDRLQPTLLNVEQERVLRAEIERGKAAIDLARQMPNYPYGRFAVKWNKDFLSTLFPHLQEARGVANLMKYDARLRAHNNNVAGSLHDVKAILYASRALGDEETSISQLVRIACSSVAASALESCLACGRASEATLLDVQKELELEAQVPFFQIGLRGERAFIDNMLQSIQLGEITYSQFRSQMVGLSGFPGFTGSEWQAELKTIHCFLNIRNERARTLHLMNELVEFTKLPTWEMLAAIESEDKSHKDESPLSGALVPVSAKVGQADARVKAVLRCAYTAVAMERFHLAKGRWPQMLDELVPQYLLEVPRDPHDGAPLRLARKETAIVIYSVSADKQDHGGILLDDPYTPGFVLHDPASRRRPAKPFVFPQRDALPLEDPDSQLPPPFRYHLLWP